MRIFIILLCFGFLNLDICAQELDNLELIEFKAKLLTTHRYGLNKDSSNVISEIISQSLEYIPTKIEALLFMKIKFNQKYLIKREYTYSNRPWIGDCYFYLVFNKKNSKFYRLGGFDSNDVDDFFEDLSSEDYRYIFSLESFEENQIDFFCLKKYNNWSKKKKRKKGYKCFPKCSGTLSTQIIVR